LGVDGDREQKNCSQYRKLSYHDYSSLLERGRPRQLT